jgi:serine/threonine protein kinase
VAPDPLFERLRRALLPDYEVERELARGGMGVVYVAHDVTLNIDVAVKLLRPELDTAHAAEAFHREARILASIRHPNVVTIYRSQEKQGLHYYIMELVGGPTLARRLEDGGKLPLEHAVHVGEDLLSGLEAVHHAGVVHRDVKPSNSFLLPDRALLADFGISRPPSGEPRTTQNRPPHAVEGTPGYMAPEQIDGSPITVRTDLYSAGAVIYEAITGRRYPPLGELPSWKDVPYRIAQVLRRALRPVPADRWPDARAFRRALRSAYRRFWQLATLIGVAGVGLGAAIVIIAVRPPRCGSPVTVALPTFEYVGPPAHRAIADSLPRLVRAHLSGHPDFCLTDSRRAPSHSAGGLLFSGTLTVHDSTVSVELGNMTSTLSAPLRQWPTLRDSLGYRVLLGVWDAQSPLAASLPVRALPQTAAGLARFFEAEQFVAAAQWENAYKAYLVAESVDSTCWLCDWRVSEVERWLGRGHDPARVRRYLAHADSFGPLYATLIRAPQLPLTQRLDSLQGVTRQWREVFLGWFQLGDETFHRGPLAGHARAEAIAPLERATRLRRDFGPAWEHLAWARIAEHDSAGAVEALAVLDARGSSQDRYAAGLRLLLKVAFAWRFDPEPVALAITRGALADSAAAAFPDLGAGPRLLGSFDVPAGQVALGEMLAGNAARDLRRSGLIAAALGSVALGRPAHAREFTRVLTSIAPDRETVRFAAELDAAIAFTETGARSDVWAHITSAVTDSVAVEAASPQTDPFYRTIVQLSRAERDASQGDLEGARRALLWHENTDLWGLPTDAPQAAEIDWAFGTVARWRLARLLDGAGQKAPACEAYRAVVRLWSAGEPLYRARADSAGARIQQLGCAPGQ